jgi:predicted alpha/beta-hydrolase family hydrolase
MDTLIVTHGAGGNRDAPLLLALDAAFQSAGVLVSRMNLPFREKRPQGPPFPGEAERDREAIATAAGEARRYGASRVFLGGHSYGGRQTTMLAASQPGVADALLLLSYPLHPPRKPAQLRTAHWPDLSLPCLFVHGTRDPFGSTGELREAMSLLPGKSSLMECEGAGHDLRTKRCESFDQLALTIVGEFARFAGL